MAISGPWNTLFGVAGPNVVEADEGICRLEVGPYGLPDRCGAQPQDGFAVVVASASVETYGGGCTSNRRGDSGRGRLWVAVAGLQGVSVFLPMAEDQSSATGYQKGTRDSIFHQPGLRKGSGPEGWGRATGPPLKKLSQNLFGTEFSIT